MIQEALNYFDEAMAVRSLISSMKLKAKLMIERIAPNSQYARAGAQTKDASLYVMQQKLIKAIRVYMVDFTNHFKKKDDPTTYFDDMLESIESCLLTDTTNASIAKYYRLMLKRDIGEVMQRVAYSKKMKQMIKDFNQKKNETNVTQGTGTPIQ